MPCFSPNFSNQTWKLTLQSLSLFLSLLFAFFILLQGLPSEFIYNIPWMRESLGQGFPNEAILVVSNSFKNPLLNLAILATGTFELAYLFYVFTNVLLFVTGPHLIFKDNPYKAFIFCMLFLLTGGKLLFTGTSSSFCFSILLTGYGLHEQGHKKALTLFCLILFWVYPLAVLLIACLHFLSLLKKRQVLSALSFTTILLVNSFVWLYLKGSDLNESLYSVYVTFDQLLRDPYYFGPAGLDLAESATIKGLILSALSDNSKLGSTLATLSPNGTMRYLYLVLIAIGLLSSSKYLIAHIRKVVPLILGSFAFYLVSFLLLFKLYFPNRFVEAPLMLALIYLATESFWILRWKKTIVAMSLLLAAIHYQYNPILPSIINTQRYLGYQDVVVRELDYPRLLSHLDSIPLKNIKFMATPRLSDLLMLEKQKLIPYISYKFTDRSFQLRQRSETFWEAYTQGNYDNLKSLCKESGSDLIIFERSFLKLLKQKNWNKLGRGILAPHRERIQVEQLPFIDTSINSDFKIGDFEILYCSPSLKSFNPKVSAVKKEKY